MQCLGDEFVRLFHEHLSRLFSVALVNITINQLGGQVLANDIRAAYISTTSIQRGDWTQAFHQKYVIVVSTTVSSHVRVCLSPEHRSCLDHNEVQE